MGRNAVLVAIVGGSGSGKSWLAERLQAALGRRALRLSQDDFYRDRSHLPPGRRARLNFDDPRAIDWECFEQALARLHRGEPAEIPAYDFATHCRKQRWRRVEPRPVVLVEGLWLLVRPRARRLFGLSVFLECPAAIRLSRRMHRDVASRGRTPDSVREQFLCTVQPMHERYVEPQRRLANVVLDKRRKEQSVRALAARVERLLTAEPPPGRNARARSR